MIDAWKVGVREETLKLLFSTMVVTVDLLRIRFETAEHLNIRLDMVEVQKLKTGTALIRQCTYCSLTIRTG